jgi:hypothetical protein
MKHEILHEIRSTVLNKLSLVGIFSISNSSQGSNSSLQGSYSSQGSYRSGKVKFKDVSRTFKAMYQEINQGLKAETKTLEISTDVKLFKRQR